MSSLVNGKNVLAYLFFILALVSCQVPTKKTNMNGYVFNKDGSFVEPNGRRLKDIVEEKYQDGNLLIGGTTGAWALGKPTGKILDLEFNYVTPENDFKQRIIHPDNTNTWNWEAADKWIEHIAETGQIMRIHAPIGPQASEWVKAEERTAQELEKNLRDFMREMCKRYNGKKGVKYLDVVNETVTTEGNWFESKPTGGWENPWTGIGYDGDKNKTPLYLKYAFEEATKHALDMKLIYNQHADYIFGLDWNLIKETVLYLRKLGLRVDGLGCQAHFPIGWELISGQVKALEDLIDWSHQNNFEFHITEFSAWMKDGMSEQELQKQAATYKAIMEIMVDKSKNGVVGWNTWHIEDGSGWHQQWSASIFDTSYMAKPAYFAIQEVLEGK